MLNQKNVKKVQISCKTYIKDKKNKHDTYSKNLCIDKFFHRKKDSERLEFVENLCSKLYSLATLGFVIINIIPFSFCLQSTVEPFKY